MNKNRTGTLVAAAFCMVLLILDTKTALNAALQGMDICLQAVIPSLFPFFFLSAIINDRLLGADLSILKPISRLCKIPEGSESILLLGLIGGYPVGAANIYEAYRRGTLTKMHATRMLAFCNNAGPAFLFGMLAPVILNGIALWFLWFIHILSAILVGILIPPADHNAVSVSHMPCLTPSQAMHNSVRNIGVVCGWIVLFRIILGFFERWFLWLFPQSIQILIIGILELSNGCISLGNIVSLGQRFVCAAVFLSFGGICVSMQTASVIGELPMKIYITGKVLQTIISFALSAIAQRFLFPSDCFNISVPLFTVVILVLFIPVMKKAVAFPKKMRYNGEN